jgi:hypothetical protein
VYAVLPSSAALPACPDSILPGAPLAILAGGATRDDRDLAVLASRVPRGVFAADDAQCQAGDPAWVAARATAHHAVVRVVAEAGACLPLGFGTLFASTGSVLAWKAAHADGLRRTLAAVAGRQEWAVRLTEQAAAHGAWLDAHDPALRSLAAAADAAGPGRAHLLRRRLAQAREAARAAHAKAVAEALGARLSTLRCAVRADAAAGQDAARWNLLATQDAGLEPALAALAAAMDETGFSLRVTGPWPPYAFARDAWQETVHG